MFVSCLQIGDYSLLGCDAMQFCRPELWGRLLPSSIRQAAGSPETVAAIYHAAWHHISEDHIPDIYHCVNIKSILKLNVFEWKSGMWPVTYCNFIREEMCYSSIVQMLVVSFSVSKLWHGNVGVYVGR
jgi:hypothetical protein